MRSNEINDEMLAFVTGGSADRSNRAYIDASKCTNCGACADRCPVGCIKKGPDEKSFVIVAECCILCGTCVSVCSIGAPMIPGY